MNRVTLATQTDFAGWRRAARSAVLAGMPPERIVWRVGDAGGDLFATDEIEETPATVDQPAFSVSKSFTTFEHQSLQFRAEAINVLNHPNFSSRDYGANITLPSCTNTTCTPLSIAKDSTFGQPSGTFNPAAPGGPRVIQLAAKVYF